MPYVETVTSAGDTSTCTINDAGALRTVRRGQRLGSVVSATDDGTVSITRVALALNGDDVTESRTVVSLPHRQAPAPRPDPV